MFSFYWMPPGFQLFCFQPFIVLLQVVSGPDLVPKTNVLEMWRWNMKETGFQCAKMFLMMPTAKTPSVRNWVVVRLTVRFPTLDPDFQEVLSFHKYTVPKRAKRWKRVISRLKEYPANLLASSAPVCPMTTFKMFVIIHIFLHILW